MKNVTVNTEFGPTTVQLDTDGNVYTLGIKIGMIDSYTGSIDKILKSGLRKPGAQRTLWHAKANTDSHTTFKLNTRADALRHIIRYATI